MIFSAVPSALKRYPYALPGAVLLIAAAFAYTNYFIQDDAYIAFRYAGHFARGMGLVWEQGSTEYGYTSFLFTFLVGLLLKLGFSAETAAFTLSVPAYFGAIVLTYLIGQRVAASLLVPALASLALATHLTFSAYATGGLETSVQIFFVLAVYERLLCWRQTPGTTPLVWLAAYSSLALLTRLDSALLLFSAYVFLALSLPRARQSLPESATALAVATLPPLAAVALLLLGGYLAYGYAMPNTFYAKIGGHWYIDGGLRYLTNYLRAQHYAPLALLFAGTVVAVIDAEWQQRWRLRLLLLGPLALWILYLLDIGGDFMEFRLMVPTLPFFYLLVCEMALDAPRFRVWKALALTALILGGNIAQNFYVRWIDSALIEMTPLLNNWVTAKPVNWAQTGKALHDLFYTGSPDDVSVATAAAGAIAYYSDLPVIDQHGLNTRDVLEEGPTGSRPGHRYNVGMPFARRHGANLITGHPAYFCEENGLLACHHFPVGPMISLGDKRSLLLVPVGNQCYLVTHYLNQHPAIDALIEKGEILTYKTAGSKLSCGGRLPGDKANKKP